MKNITKIVDTFGREHNYLRISLTERCNLRCFYCMPEEGVALREKSCFMTSEEVIEIAQQFVDLGVTKIRLTGGEPLIKKDIDNILIQLSKLPVELGITTNGVLVDQHINTFKEAGIKSVNVSLDSLKEERFNSISRRNYFKRIRSNIDLLIKNEFNVKVNVVLIKGVNDDEIVDFIDWTVSNPLQVRFIEFMPFDGNKWNWDNMVPRKRILEIAEKAYGEKHIIKVKDRANDTTANYRLFNSVGSFGIISSMSNPFCDTCNRIRLTADGKIRNCLFSNSEIDLLASLRKNQDLKPIILESILNKKKQRGGLKDFEKAQFTQNENRSMVTIGG
ncbi:MAG: GTP 3',8-cyclase MoaA [Crocinitomicaceae bacterium]|nr:GTP 3',8-cyclase MoaA [Crocinitomicaceae bacterium]